MDASSRGVRWRITVVVLAVISIAGCSPTEQPRGFWGKLWGFEVGPDYQRPKVMPAVEFRSQLGPSEAVSFADLPWWQVIDDKVLQGLIVTALEQNYDLQLATARVQQARALVGVAASQLYPQIGYQGFAGREKSFVPLEETGGNLTFNAFSGLFNAVWEIDVWGRIRRSTEAARANLFAQEYIRRGVMLTLVSDVATDYFGLLELDRELVIAQDSSKTYKQTLDLFTQRFEFGKDSKLPVARAQAAFDSSIATITSLKRAITQQENALSGLLGDYPKEIGRGDLITEQPSPQTPLGLTSDLMQRRPDILEAEQNMISANAQVGVAVANFFPRIGVSALYGGQSPKIGDVLDNNFSIWNIFGGLTGPVFQGGQILGTYHTQQAFWDTTIAQYKQTILVAFQEVSDALIAQQTLVPQREAEEHQVAALKEAVDLSLLRYDAGRASYFEVLEAEQLLFPAEDALAQTHRDQLLAVVNLYKALGGGWNLSDSGWLKPH
ncbi:MAG TPA: efflux transporter outer membrane subunit [Candidatus Binataceae bacterium]|nr:efflux transporter outer membrane subunit [Candidatus Binataceae bacterium]